MQLREFRRQRLASLPTPLELLPRLSRYLGGPQIYVKRDDQTGLALGGNKARKLEFLLAEAIDQGCDTIVTTGGVQSNHARQTAAAAARLGLRCELLLPKLVRVATPEYENSGNVLLDRLCGAKLHMPLASEFTAESADQVLNALRREGRKPYFIPTGGSTPLGSLGYVNAVHELLQQADENSLSIDAIIVPTGSAGTHAGILAGLIDLSQSTQVFGMAVSATMQEKENLVISLTEQVLELLSVNADSVRDRTHVDDRFVGPGYGLPTEAMVDAVQLLARQEGLMFDPVYTGKAMAGLIAAVRDGQFSTNDNVVFWHTGGTPALFAYRDLFDGSS